MKLQIRKYLVTILRLHQYLVGKKCRKKKRKIIIASSIGRGANKMSKTNAYSYRNSCDLCERSMYWEIPRESVTLKGPTICFFPMDDTDLLNCNHENRTWAYIPCGDR